MIALSQEQPRQETCERAAAARAERPFVSVIIPVKNDARRLETCLESLRRQTYAQARYEIVVVDNGSRDDSAAVAEEFAAIVERHPGLKVGALRNRGVARARGTVLAFIDSDHEAPPDWLAQGVDALARDPHIAAVGCHYLPPRNGTWVQTSWAIHRLRGNQRQATRWLGAGNLFVWRAEFDRVGGFHEALVAAEDVDLCLKLSSAGKHVVNDPGAANIHHGEPRTLGQFSRKEYWRGSSGLRAFWLQGCPWRELPSLIYPIYYLLAVALLVASLVAGMSLGSIIPVLIGLAALAAPALMLGLWTGLRYGQPTSVIPLAVLYAAYGLARAAALFKK